MEICHHAGSHAEIIRREDKLIRPALELFQMTIRTYASVAMLQSSKAYALLQGRDFVTPEDIKFVAPYVLQHRLILTAEAEMEGYSPVKVTQRLIDKVEVPK